MRIRIAGGEPFELPAGRDFDVEEPGVSVQLTLEEALLWAVTLRNRADDVRVARRERALRCAGGNCGEPKPGERGR